MPESLVKEGTLMRDALLRDLNVLKQYQLITMHDARLAPSEYAQNSMAVAVGDFDKVFKKALKQADFVWLIAPETNGVLLELTEHCLKAEAQKSDALLLGCGFDATLTSTSKSLCFEAMQAAQIFTLPVYAGEDLNLPDCYETLLKQNIGQWVAKPEDGAGCDGIRIFDSLDHLKLWVTEDSRYLNYLAQPYQGGVAASFSMLCRDGKAWLLSCNQQHIACDGNQFKLTGITVNGMLTYWQRFETIARKIAKMLPDALGYVGVDVIVDVENNDKIYALEINPRLTTSYIGLHEALNYNPAKLILDCVLNDKFEMPVLARKQVEIQL
ncbi:MAG: ATP-grasp domain-containing protein [Methylotenera sp.]|nr:ATP-grasp domain-containing protein [Methylotenera sp.]